jgi:UDP-glucose 4-epimerase
LGKPSNLFPVLGQVALGQREQLQIHGGDWPTADGGEKDFIHVMELAEGHHATLRYLDSCTDTLLTLNLGSGNGHTVKQMLQAYGQAYSRELP